MDENMVHESRIRLIPNEVLLLIVIVMPDFTLLLNLSRVSRG